MILTKSIKSGKTLKQFLSSSEGGNIGRRVPGSVIQAEYQNLDQSLCWNLYQGCGDVYTLILESEVDKYQLIQYPNIPKFELERVERFLI